MAMMPTTTEVHLEHVGDQVVGDRTARRHDQTTDRAEHGGEGDRGDHREQQLIEALGQQRRRHVAVGRIERATGHRT
jgi:hypothetical protein